MVKRLSRISNGIAFPSTQKLLSAVDRYLERELKKAGVSQDTIADLAISVSELVNNAILHGNQRDESKKVILQLFFETGAVTICVEDEGKGFDPEQVANPLEGENLMREVGRGIFIVRSLVDSVEFLRGQNGGVRVKLVKKFAV